MFGNDLENFPLSVTVAGRCRLCADSSFFTLTVAIAGSLVHLRGQSWKRSTMAKALVPSLLLLSGVTLGVWVQGVRGANTHSFSQYSPPSILS